MRFKRFGLRRYAGLVAAVIGLTVGVGVAFAVSGATSTTDNPGYTDTGDAYVNGSCHNGHGVNCNIYDNKKDVWLSGLPTSVGAGTYFFAVLVPGGQNDPNDGATDNLSDAPGGDAWTNRVFDVASDGTITYHGTHEFDPNNNKIQVFPYDDTTNPGGVYILAVCQVPADPSDDPGVDAKDCKFDAFKVNSGAQNPPASDLVVTKTATPSFSRAYDWSVTKSLTSDSPVDTSASSTTASYEVTATWSGPTDGGWEVTGKISVFNPNSFDVSGVDVTDSVNDGGSCSVTGGTDQTIPAETTSDFDYTCTYSSKPDPLDGKNTAEATWDPSGDMSGTSGDATFDVDFSFDDGSAGNPTVTHDTSTVTDTFNGGSPDTIGVAGIDGSFDDTGNTLDNFSETYDSLSQTFTFDYTRDVTVVAGTCTTYDNEADVSSDATSNDNSDTASVEVCGGSDLTVAKTATPAFTRTYKWTIKKSVVGSSVVRTTATTVKFTYNVVVNSATPAYTDSGYTVSGSITVTNPNDWEDIVATITDSIGANWSCSVTNGANQTVPKGDKITRNYSCSWTGTGAPTTGTNTGKATWDASAAFTPDGTATGTADFNFANATVTSVNKTITVTDTYAGTLGTVTYGVTTLPKTFTYYRTVNVGTTECVTYDNTATITETGQNSSAEVKACPAVTGLTIGYWHNKNGQAQISGAGTTVITDGSGNHTVCKLTPYLRGFNPFKDLTQYASCAQVAAYDLTVFNAATCGGSSCIPMLKAQMLATALNVYFGATNGNLVIDLVHGCSMADKSDGSGSCSGSENWSSAFGGATSLSITDMLNYAASQYVSATSWYGTSKTLQTLAKDAFDAINNGTAITI